MVFQLSRVNRFAKDAPKELAGIMSAWNGIKYFRAISGAYG
jgi:hypothetical protein